MLCKMDWFYTPVDGYVPVVIKDGLFTHFKLHPNTKFIISNDGVALAPKQN